MDFLQKAGNQLTELFRSMTPAARIVAGLLLVAIVVSLGYLFQFGYSSGDEYLLGGEVFSNSEIRNMSQAFAKAGLGDFDTTGNRVKVPRGKKVEYLAALAENGGLPADLSTTMDEAIGSNAFEPKDQREAKLNNAKQEYLGLVISRMKGVEAATVTYDEEVISGFPRRKQASAMIAVWPDGSNPLEEFQVRTIRDLIAASFALLDHKSITVIDQHAGISHNGSAPDGHYLASEDPYRKLKLIYETDWQEKIEKHLTTIPGVLVAVNVELNPELSHEEIAQKFDPQPVAIANVESNRESTSKNQPAGGQPGAVPNGVGSNQPATVSAAGSRESTDSETTSNTKSVVGRSQTRTKKASLVPTRVAVSIDLPLSYFNRVWQQANPEATDPPTAADLKRIEDDQIKKIEETVAQLLPPRPPGDDVYRPIMVTTYQDLPTPPPPEVGFTVPVWNWLAAHWQSLGAFGLGLVCLVMLRGMTKSAVQPVGGAAGPVDGSPHAAANFDDEDEEEEVEQIRRFANGLQPKGPNLRAELASMVQQDPEAAVSVLQNWIGDVS